MPNSAVSRAMLTARSFGVGPPGPSESSIRKVSGAKSGSSSRPPATRCRMNVSQSRSSGSRRYHAVWRRVRPAQSASRVVLPKPASATISPRRAGGGPVQPRVEPLPGQGVVPPRRAMDLRRLHGKRVHREPPAEQHGTGQPRPDSHQPMPVARTPRRRRRTSPGLRCRATAGGRRYGRIGRPGRAFRHAGAGTHGIDGSRVAVTIGSPGGSGACPAWCRAPLTAHLSWSRRNPWNRDVGQPRSRRRPGVSPRTRTRS